jgi:DNA-directed RNA polymerase specialized sigma24 family protein
MLQLPEGFRLAIILVDIQELDYIEAATVLHIPVGTLKSRLARARMKLRMQLHGQDRREYRKSEVTPLIREWITKAERSNTP